MKSIHPHVTGNRPGSAHKQIAALSRSLQRGLRLPVLERCSGCHCGPEGKPGMQLGKLASHCQWRKHLVSQSSIAPEGAAIPSPKCKVFLNHFPKQLQLLSKVMAIQKEHTNQNSLLA